MKTQIAPFKILNLLHYKFYSSTSEWPKRLVIYGGWNICSCEKVKGEGEGVREAFIGERRRMVLAGGLARRRGGSWAWLLSPFPPANTLYVPRTPDCPWFPRSDPHVFQTSRHHGTETDTLKPFISYSTKTPTRLDPRASIITAFKLFRILVRSGKEGKREDKSAGKLLVVCGELMMLAQNPQTSSVGEIYSFSLAVVTINLVPGDCGWVCRQVGGERAGGEKEWGKRTEGGRERKVFRPCCWERREENGVRRKKRGESKDGEEKSVEESIFIYVYLLLLYFCLIVSGLSFLFSLLSFFCFLFFCFVLWSRKASHGGAVVVKECLCLPFYHLCCW